VRVIIRMFAVALLLYTPSVIAQVATPAEARTVSQVVDFWVTNIERLIVSAADAMPERNTRSHCPMVSLRVCELLQSKSNT